MNIPFLDLKAQYQQIKAEVLPVVTHAMENGAFIGGEHVVGFEREFAAFCGSRFCIGVGSGTDALRFALLARDIGPGDEVITVANTFIATTEAISQASARPVFVDVDPRTYTIDVSQIEARITTRTRAIVPVHLYGQPADMDPILDLAAHRNLVVIEDACQAHGAMYKGRKAGTMGAAGCFSFYPGKNLGAFGEAGAVVTQNEDTARKIRMLRDHGQQEKYVHLMEGYNGRLDAIQAAVLRVKLKRLAAWNQRRHDRAKTYNDLLSGIAGITLPFEAGYATSVYHLYVILSDRRDELCQFLSQHGIATGLHYPIPLHLQKAYAGMEYTKGDFPVTEHVAERLLSLPLFPELTDTQMAYVAEHIKMFLHD